MEEEWEVVPQKSSMASLVRGAPMAHGFIYALLFAGNLVSNKYVLSELGFTYPTVFQGWQVLIGASFLKVASFLTGSKSRTVVGVALDKPGFISLLPTFLLFVGSLVAGSKSLAVVDVPQFLACANASQALVYLFDVFPKFKNASFSASAACLVVIATTVTIVLLELAGATVFSESPYFWMLVFVLCSSVHVIHGRIADARFEPVDRLYYSYLVGVCLLAPASLYLDEAFQALNFARNSRIHFFLGCLASGLLGVTSSFIAAQLTTSTPSDDLQNPNQQQNLRKQRMLGFFLNVAKCLAAAFSYIAFAKGADSGWIVTCVIFNLLAGFLIPPPADPTVSPEMAGFQALPVVRAA